MKDVSTNHEYIGILITLRFLNFGLYFNFMKAIELSNLISTGNYQKLRETLMADPGLANLGIPCSDHQPEMKGHPLHRICDAVFAKVITDEQAI
jgi:hypothetical protein